MAENVLFFDKDNLGDICWDCYIEGEKIKEYFMPLLQAKTNELIRNVNTSICFVAIDNVLLPYTVNESEYDNSYVCSPYNHYITYSKEELSMLNNKYLEVPLRLLLSILDIFVKYIHINKVVYLNNWLISTNLSPHLTEEQLSSLHYAILKKYPSHLIGYRSLNDGLYPEMIKDLKKLNYVLLPSRFVYISEPEDILHARKKVRNTLKRDKKLFDNQEFEVIYHNEFTEADLIRAKQLYDQLYLEKYSYNNPQFSEQYILSTHKERALNYIGLKKNGRLEGVFGSIIFQNKMANPVLGYNTDLPKDKGLYRMLRYLAVNESIKHNRSYHQSAGVGRFKHDRGARGYPEYTAIFINHLSIFKKIFWKSLSYLLNHFAIKMIDQKKL